MSKVSARKRNRITLALGAFSMLMFGSLYGVIASNAAVGQSTTVVPSVDGTSQSASLVLTGLQAKAAPTPAPTAAPTQATTTTHTTSRGS